MSRGSLWLRLSNVGLRPRPPAVAWRHRVRRGLVGLLFFGGWLVLTVSSGVASAPESRESLASHQGRVCGATRVAEHGQGAVRTSRVSAFKIPRAALAYRALLMRTARQVFGLSAPVATLAAQVQQESWWRVDTRSSAGAEGLAQFMPGTAAWLSTVRPEIGVPAPYSPAWALRALCVYDKWLFERTRARSVADVCERAAFTLSAYNGGEAWVRRDQALARRAFTQERYFDHTERVNAGRSLAAWHENRRYVRRILGDFEALYESAGWGTGLCEGVLATPPAAPVAFTSPHPQMPVQGVQPRSVQSTPAHEAVQIVPQSASTLGRGGAS